MTGVLGAWMMGPMHSWMRWLVLFLLVPLLWCRPALAGDEAKLAAAATKARDLARRLQAAVGEDRKGRVTMAVAIVDGGRIVIASSESGVYLRPGVEAIKDAEHLEVADGPAGHAEEKVVDFIRFSLFKHLGSRILVVAAGRPICVPCEKVILDAGAKPASPCSSGRTYL